MGFLFIFELLILTKWFNILEGNQKRNIMDCIPKIQSQTESCFFFLIFKSKFSIVRNVKESIDDNK